MNATPTPLSPLAPYAATLLRLALGVLFLVHALTKLLVFTPAGTAAFFESLGLPGVLGYLTIAVELAISAALLLGIYARWIGLLGVPLLLGTIVTVHGANGFSFANAGGGWEYPAFWALALVVLFLLGDGRWTLRSR
ncbi:MAG: DoxX family protein [Stenotrophomonas indicatrix]|jgi:putative oxidoreductase|uniref:DoxX family protein n=1 Tax=Stenotrophomonas TaxID=40323 RepID=UPI0003EA7C1A|nr:MULTISPECIES: DoxX family protein [Stenotrophomonas]EVT71029.1 LysR family transcriptional regulator [Stenotrophomonas maltophilia 5BA-I-2]OJH78211.1 MAG: LysR family transcriptional regulator [Stenotrophomonas maltophilia]MCK6232759.1 DoxX family protein [Stenotrophomonas indicatrix]MDF2481317.1 LysR family transcriptional regulator [Stenotrophomonas indicatrix]MDR6695407.1 putative oxidoreductase [Stenotrophomonas sp. 1337]